MISPGSKTEMWTELKALTPGTYTIIASSWPVAYSLSAIRDYGYDRFYEDVRLAQQHLTIQDTDTEIELLFDLSTE